MISGEGEGGEESPSSPHPAPPHLTLVRATAAHSVTAAHRRSSGTVSGSQRQSHEALIRDTSSDSRETRHSLAEALCALHASVSSSTPLLCFSVPSNPPRV